MFIENMGMYWLRRGYEVSSKQVGGNHGPTLKNYGKKINAEDNFALAA